MDALMSDTDAESATIDLHTSTLSAFITSSNAVLQCSYTSLILRTRTREHTSEALESA